MGEQAKKSDTELAIARNRRLLEGAQEDVAGIHPKVINNDDFAPFSEDFLDPQHPLYGTVDEHGRPIPGWMEQITVRFASFKTCKTQAKVVTCCRLVDCCERRIHYTFPSKKLKIFCLCCRSVILSAGIGFVFNLMVSPPMTRSISPPKVIDQMLL